MSFDHPTLKFVSDEVDRKNREAFQKRGLDRRSLELIEAAEESVRLFKELRTERPDIH